MTAADPTDNLAIWEKLSHTDRQHTKSFKRAGGFTGTATKPVYLIQKMTEAFGPCGSGWGFTEPTYQLVNGENREVLVFCWLTLWYIDPATGAQSQPVPGVGGDKVVGYIKANEQYKRPERWENDDEAFKKAFTDALGNAMKHLGMSADVHMGMFDGSKYQGDDEERAPARQHTAVRPSAPETVARAKEIAAPESAPVDGFAEVERNMLATITNMLDASKLDRLALSPRFTGDLAALPEEHRGRVEHALRMRRATLSNLMPAG